MSSTEEEARPDLLSRAISVGVVAATLAIAVVGYLLSQTSKAEDRASADAQTFQIESFSRQVSAASDARLVYEQYLRAQLQRRRAVSAREQRLLGLGVSAAEQRLEASQQRYLADLTQARSEAIAESRGLEDLDPDGEYGPAQDPFFPVKYLSAAQRGDLVLFAKADAAADEAAQYGEQETAYLAILAIFGVVAFLYGFSLNPSGRRNRNLFSGVATVLAAVAAVWAIETTADGPGRAAPEAAKRFADGQIAFATRDFPAAQRELQRAIELRPGFARAYTDLAFARSAAGGLPEEPLPTLVPLSVAKAALADVERAKDLGLDDFATLGNLGASRINVGIQTRDDELLRNGVELSEEAERIDTTNPLYALNIGLAYIGLGDRAEARRAYDRAADKIVAVNRDPGEPPNVAVQNLNLGAALSAMQLARNAYGEEVEDLTADLERRLVGRIEELSGRVTGSPPIPEGFGGEVRKLTGDSLFISPKDLELDPLWGMVRDGDTLRVFWYRNVEGAGWVPMSGDFGWFTGTQVNGGPETGYTPPAVSDHLLASFPPSCLRSGRYRADVWLNGQLVASGETRGRQGTLKATSDPTVGARYCAPPGWKRSPSSVPGLISGSVAPSGDRGIYVARILTNPLEAPERNSSPVAFARKVLDRTLADFEYLLPGRATFLEEFPDVDVIDVRYEVQRDYSVPGGEVFGAAAIQSDGTTLVAFVFGPDAYMERGQPLTIFNAITQDPTLSFFLGAR